MAAFCRRHSYRGGKPPAELLRRLRNAPIAPVGLPDDTLRTIIAAQVASLRAVQAALTDVEAAIADRVAAHPRARLLEQLPGVGMINRPATCRGRSDPGPRRHRRASSHRMRRRTRDQGIRQDHRRLLPLGRQHPRPAKPSLPSPTTPECNHPGQAVSTPTLAPAANATPTPPASWPVPGSASSGRAGTPEPLRPRPPPRAPSTHTPTRVDLGNSSATSPDRSTNPQHAPHRGITSLTNIEESSGSTRRSGDAPTSSASSPIGARSSGSSAPSSPSSTTNGPKAAATSDSTSSPRPRPSTKISRR